MNSTESFHSLIMSENFTSLPTIGPEDHQQEKQNEETGGQQLKAAGGVQQHTLTQVKINEEFLKENGFDVIEYLNQGKYGTVYSAIANELAIKFYAINQIPEGGVIGENVWQSGTQFYVQKSLTGIKVAIKFIAPPQLQPWDDPNEQISDELLLSTFQGYEGLLSADFPEKVGHPLEEVRKLMKLNHPNIVEIYNVLHDEGRGVYIVMEYLEMNLEEWVQGMNENNVRLDDRSILIFMDQLIGGLSYLHNNNILHNDLHSGNVMVTEDEEGCILMKIMDFGEARYFNQVTQINPTEADIKGLGLLLQLVVTLLDSNNPEFKEGLDVFIYTCLKRVFSNMDEMVREFQCLSEILKREDSESDIIQSL